MNATPIQFEVCLRKAIEELERRHGLGLTQVCESVLADFPEIRQRRDSVLELIYFEFVLAHESGQPISDDELQSRFPEYETDLKKILTVDRAFRNPSDTDALSGETSRNEPKKGFENGINHRDSFERFGDYELLEIIGQGGMGVVYKARQRRLNRFVAVKTIDILSSLNPTAVARFNSEAELAAKLQHSNIVQVHEVGLQQGVPYFSMELITGGTLAEATQERPLPPVIAAKIVETLARAVDYAHSRSIVHRDLKPSNILLSPSERSEAIELPVDADRATHAGVGLPNRFEPKIADFGLAKYLEGALDRTATQAMIGTPSYIAPELIDRELGNVGPACDIYSLGAILYDAMVGRPPFNAASVIETIQLVRNSDVVPPSNFQAKIPRDLETICLKCLRKEPSKRYDTAVDLANDLQRFLNGQPILARPAGVLEHSWKWAQRHPSLTLLIAGVLVATLSITLLWLRSEQSRIAKQAALKRNDQLLYVRDIALAQFEYQSNRVERSREILDQTRPEYRGWEWSYLYHQINAYEWESPKQQHTISRADISHDGKFVAFANDKSGSEPQSLQVWDISKNELMWEHQVQTGQLLDIRFSPNSALLLTASRTNAIGSTGGVKLWDVSNGALRREVYGSSAAVSRFGKDGKCIFVGGANGVTQYTIDTCEMIRTFDSGPSSIMDLDFNPDGSLMVVATLGKGLSLWDTISGEKLQTLTQDSVHTISWSPDGKKLSEFDVFGSRRLHRFEKGLFKQVDQEQNKERAHGRFTGDGRRFVSTEFGKSIEIHDSANGLLEKSLPAHNGNTHRISFSSSGRYMVTGGGDCRVRVWDLAFTDRRHLQSQNYGFTASAIVSSPSNTEMALAYGKSGKKTPRIEIRNAKSHKIERELIGHTGGLTCAAYSLDGKRLVSGSTDKTVRVWDPITSDQLAVLDGHESPISGVAFLADSRFAVSMDKAGTVNVWNIENKSIERSWKLDATVQSVAFHPIRPLVAVAYNGKGVGIWEVMLGKKLAELPLVAELQQVCFSPNGQRLATVGVKASTLVWSTDEVLQGYGTPPIGEPIGRSDTLQNVSFSPDGGRLISCCADASVRLFDVECGHELLTLELGRGRVGIVQFSPNGKTIIRAQDGSFSAWTIDDLHASTSNGSSQVSDLAWHQSEADAAKKSQNWFAAQFHQGFLTKLEPDKIDHFLNRAVSRMLLGDFAGAEEDLRHCDGKLDAVAQKQLLRDLARTCLSQEKWPEYGEICSRLFQDYRDSNSQTDLNYLLWYCALGNASTIDTRDIKQKVETIAGKSKFRKSYLSALALSHYRDQEYRKAIECAEEKIKLLSGSPAPGEWMIIALSFARLDQQRIGWLPRFIQSKIREWGFSSQWTTSVEHVRKADAWIALQSTKRLSLNTQLTGQIKDSSRETQLYMRIELSRLKKEWDEIANSK